MKKRNINDNDGIAITTISKKSESEGDNIWKGFKFPMGAFLVWSTKGKMAWGKCDPITKEVIEWNEASDEM